MTDSLKHTLKFSFIKTQGTFYSAPSILAVFRNVVREMWFEKSGSRKVVLQTWIFFSGSRKMVDQKNRWVYTINPPFFRLEKSGSANLDFFSRWRPKEIGGFKL